MPLVADLLFDARTVLGEGPIYCTDDHALVWIDIPAQRVHRLGLSTGRKEEMDVGQSVGAVALRAGGGFVFALRDGFALADSFGGPLSLVAEVEKDLPHHRMNDGKCDRAGRFFAGSMADDETPGAGSFYRLDGQGRATAMFGGVTISNGLCWNADETAMFYIDSHLARVDVFDYNAGEGALSNRRVLFEVPQAHGTPDGMTIDDEGCLWIAHWGGGAVRRYTPSGKVDRVVEVPASLVTCCSFGGADHSELYITTASIGLTDEQRAQQPLAGAVFAVRTTTSGAPAHPYRG
jgi:sugar lactone lactonase YvrE